MLANRYLRILSISLLVLSSCQAKHDNFTLCSAQNEFSFIEILEEHGEFFATDYVGDIKLCEQSKSCIALPLLISVPPSRLKDEDDSFSWIDASNKFSSERVGGDLYNIHVSAPWGHETYEYSTTDGLLKRTVQISSTESEIWNRCAGKLRFSDLEDIIDTTIKKKRLFEE